MEMKDVRYFCDGCKRQFSNEHELLRIGSEDGKTLSLTNNLQIHGTVGVRSLGNYGDIHFCSPECLHSFLFVPRKHLPDAE